ncbi:ECF RNA polymerase sigma factor SigK [Microlunatus sp. GCM10028923]|uniref:ECF RNA polymerase sigma factor SigK n=1 Tax=Microlunatus sp. GCM10028923 TaxID=3273400 RepID=UPI00361AD355
MGRQPDDDHEAPRVVAVPDPAETLEQLIAQAARGHEDAFAELYDRTVARVYGLVLRVLRSPDLAAEVTQEAYVEIWRSSAGYRPESGSALSWLLAIAHHRAVDQVRSTARRTDREDRYGRPDGAEDDVVWDDISSRVDTELVRRALRSLTEVQREALTLAYFGGYTHRQVARMLELPLGTAKTRIRDGLIGLRDALGVES